MFKPEGFNGCAIQPSGLGGSQRRPDLRVSHAERCPSGPGFPFSSTVFKVTPLTCAFHNQKTLFLLNLKQKGVCVCICCSYLLYMIQQIMGS